MDTPIFDSLFNDWTDGHYDRSSDTFRFANGVGPGSHRYTDSDRETDESLYDSHIRWLNAVAERNSHRTADHTRRHVDPNTGLDPNIDDRTDDAGRHRTGYVGKPGTYYTDQHGTIHLTLDTWEQARERNRARYGNADASEQHYRPE